MLNLKYNKSMLKLFLILLGLIIFTSAFGGSIKIKENFWEELNNNQNNFNNDQNNFNNDQNDLNKPLDNIPNESSTSIDSAEPLIQPHIPNEPNKNNNNKELPIESKETIEPFQGSMFSGIIW
jgi:hypothetical protein